MATLIVNTRKKLRVKLASEARRLCTKLRRDHRGFAFNRMPVGIPCTKDHEPDKPCRGYEIEVTDRETGERLGRVSALMLRYL